jgi:hypothetical protein
MHLKLAEELILASLKMKVLLSRKETILTKWLKQTKHSLTSLGNNDFRKIPARGFFEVVLLTRALGLLGVNKSIFINASGTVNIKKI